MNIKSIEPLVKDVMPGPTAPDIDVVASPGAELLIGLAAATTADEPGARAGSWVPDALPVGVRRALDQLGSRSGELWLHLLGVALDGRPTSAAELVAQLSRLDAAELREHVVGVHVPAWRALVGTETLERAAAGDRRAARLLLAHDRYYGGEARNALASILPLGPQQTKRRILGVLKAWLPVFTPHEAAVCALLESDAASKRSLATAVDPEALITAATGGYVYEREPELRRVVLVPHVAGRPWLFLCQHRDARIICYAASEADAPAPLATRRRALALGKALGDEHRLAMLRRLTSGEASLAELAEAGTVAKSTAHHHLALLRAAGLVGIRGNARSYRYFLHPEALASSRNLLAEVLTPTNR